MNSSRARWISRAHFVFVPLLAVGLLAPTAQAGPPKSSIVDDPRGDVVVVSGTGERDPYVDWPTDLVHGDIVNNNGKSTTITWGTNGGTPGANGTVTYQALVRVTPRAKKAKKPAKAYRVVVTFNPAEPLNPVSIESSRKGSLTSVRCPGAIGAYIESVDQQHYVTMPTTCFGPKASTAKASLVATGIVAATGQVVRDGVQLRKISLRR